MINTRTIKYDGRQRNHQNGLTFYFTRQGQVLNFLIDFIGDRKRKVKVTMHVDVNHGRPHVHIGDHDASFAVDNGELLVGNCDAKTRKLMKNWCKKQVFDQQFSEKLDSADFGKLVLHVVIDKAVMRQRAAASLLGA